jgi:hypothetical protein
METMELSAARLADWQACVQGVPVSEYGDPDGQYGYVYDERDGTGIGHRPALAVDRSRRPGGEDYRFLAFAPDASCRSDAPVPGGTAGASSLAHRGTLRGLEVRTARLTRAIRRLSASAERFNAWASCVSWIPVTEYGDPDGRFGYLFGPAGAPASSYKPALAVDRSDRDDPDYMFLAFAGGDRPGRCREAGD